jgi:polar amino acid transport system substrate-binding protein
MSFDTGISRRRLGALTSLGAMAMLLSLGEGTASAAAPDEIKRAGKLRVGVMIDFPPFGGTDANEQPAGYDDDVAALMAKALGVQLDLVPVSGPNRIPYLLTDKVDVLIATLGITAKRAEEVLYSNPYSALTIYVLAPKSLTIRTAADLKDVKIGVARGATEDTSVTAIAPPGTEILRFDDDATAFEAMVTGQVQAMGASNTVLARFNKEYAQLHIEPKFTLMRQANGMAFRKSDTTFRDWSNAFIAEIFNDGDLSKISQKWFGTPLTSLPPMPQF